MEQNKGLNFPDGLRIDKRWLRALMNSFCSCLITMITCNTSTNTCYWQIYLCYKYSYNNLATNYYTRQSTDLQPSAS